MYTESNVKLSCNALWQKCVLAVTNGAIVIHTQRLKSDPGGNLLS
ncbi:chemotaxis protein [Escherichia coli]|nr:chemotaxis protein [Escherichia coli]